MAKKSLSPKASNVSSKLGSYNTTKRVIGKNLTGKATKAVGLVKASKSKKGI